MPAVYSTFCLYIIFRAVYHSSHQQIHHGANRTIRQKNRPSVRSNMRLGFVFFVRSVQRYQHATAWSDDSEQFFYSSNTVTDGHVVEYITCNYGVKDSIRVTSRKNISTSEVLCRISFL